jgi:hypothetical protein
MVLAAERRRALLGFSIGKVNLSDYLPIDSTRTVSENSLGGERMENTIQQGNLKITIEQNGPKVSYHFAGVVDEFFRHDQIPRMPGSFIRFDLSGIVNFNSCGIREWIFFIKDFTAQSQVIFEKCSVTMVDQINMIPDSLGSATVESFFAPYYRTCTSCFPESEVTCLIDLTKRNEELDQGKAPSFHCEKCKEPFEFDALEDSYFVFLEQKISKAS